jgi:endonuclease YncB( thermonuclease family)
MLATAVVPAAADDIAARADRDVSPPGVMPIPVGPLVRVPVPPTLPDPPRWRRYFLPQTPDLATFVTNGMTIHVAGVKPPARSQTCPAGDGSAWPCGASALYAFRRFLHGRAVECYFPSAEGVSDVTAPCRGGRADIGLWLLQNGWARTDELATADYRATETAAACAALGLWRGTAPPANCPAAAALPVR